MLSPSSKVSGSRISAKTAQRIIDAGDKLGYRLNQTARSLRAQKTNMIALMIADISNPMYHMLVRTVQGIARSRGYDLLIANTDHIYDNELHFLEAIMRRPVDGVLMVPYRLTVADLENFITLARLPVVILAWPASYPSVDSVSADDETATHEMITWLIEQKGHRRIGFIGVPASLPAGDRRRAGFLSAMQSAGLAVRPETLVEGDFSIESGRAAMHRLLGLPDPPTAVFACNDLMALGALDTALELGLCVPQQVAIVGFDDIPEASIIRPRLTTIAQFPVLMGQQMTKLLFERIDGVAGPRQFLEVPCRLIERETT